MMSKSDISAEKHAATTSVVKSIFEDFNLSGVSEDVCVRVLDIIYSISMQRLL